MGSPKISRLHRCHDLPAQSYQRYPLASEGSSAKASVPDTKSVFKRTPPAEPAKAPAPVAPKPTSDLFGRKGTTPSSAPVSLGDVPVYKSVYYLEDALRKAVKSRTRQVVFALDMKLPPTRTLDDVANDGCYNSLRKEEVKGTYSLTKRKDGSFEVIFKY